MAQPILVPVMPKGVVQRQQVIMVLMQKGNGLQHPPFLHMQRDGCRKHLVPMPMQKAATRQQAEITLMQRVALLLQKELRLMQVGSIQSRMITKLL